MAVFGMRCAMVIFFATICKEVFSATEMSMEPNAVDDVYTECREEMLNKVSAKDGLLQEELKDAKFKSQWDSSSSCQTLITGGLPIHTQALRTFGHSDTLAKRVNKAVQSKGGDVNTYKNEFAFKSLHFLLMDAMQLLNNGSKCDTVYVGTFDDLTAVQGAEVRFGRFLSANRDRSFAEEGCADGGTLFSIKSCSAVDLETYACAPEYTVLLLSPVEVFKVSEVRNTGSDCSREIVLTHSGYHSNHDCYLFPRAPPTTLPPTTPRPTAARTTSSPTGSSAGGSGASWTASRGLILLTLVSHLLWLSLAP